jgi:6-pyruvoyltetrahydropterin/6-carboxytetrahydropterin synthase
MERFSIRLSGDDLVFSAAHFITLGTGECERLHGHNYRVLAEISGPLGDQSYVYDFVLLRGLLKEILTQLDHRVLLPAEHPQIRIRQRAGEIEVSFGQRRWVFPRQECEVLPVRNTTAEMSAEHIGRQLLARFSSAGLASPTRLQIEVEEGAGSSASWEWSADRS